MKGEGAEDIVFCALALHRWRARVGREVRAWILALGEVEALASLATFSFEHPDFAFPEVGAGDPMFEAEGLGHPLIPASRRVCNDVSLGGEGHAADVEDRLPVGAAQCEHQRRFV